MSGAKLPDARTVMVRVATVVPTSARRAPFLQHLGDDEHERTRRFRNPLDADAYVVAHVLLRRWLGLALGGVAPREVPIVAREHTKPRLATPSAWRFSLSHTLDFVAVALAYERDVGVDIEALRPLDDPASFAEEMLSERERARLALLAPDDVSDAIYETWTTKEAYFKAKGLRLETDPRLLDTGAGDEPDLCVPRSLDASPASWRLWRREREHLWKLGVAAWDPARETTLEVEDMGSS